MRKYTLEKQVEVFWSYVNKNGSIPKHCSELGRCWEWTRSTNTPNGYGQFVTGSKHRLAHHFSWELIRGEIPDSLYVLHKCDNKLCINPAHLFLGTQQDNINDKIAKGRESKHLNKLIANQVNEIRKKFFEGSYTRKELADEYHVTAQNIGSIVNGKSWKHLDFSE